MHTNRAPDHPTHESNDPASSSAANSATRARDHSGLSQQRDDTHTQTELSPDEQALNAWADNELNTALQVWWSMQKGLWDDLRALAVAEGSLAIRSLAQLVTGTVVAVLLVFVCILLIQGLLALLLQSLGLPLVATLLGLLALNLCGVTLLIRLLLQLPNNLTFRRTRAELHKSEKTEEES